MATENPEHDINMPHKIDPDGNVISCPPRCPVVLAAHDHDGHVFGCDACANVRAANVQVPAHQFLLTTDIEWDRSMQADQQVRTVITLLIENLRVANKRIAELEREVALNRQSCLLDREESLQSAGALGNSPTLMQEEIRVLRARIAQLELMFNHEKTLAEHYREQFRTHRQRANH